MQSKTILDGQKKLFHTTKMMYNAHRKTTIEMKKKLSLRYLIDFPEEII